MKDKEQTVENEEKEPSPCSGYTSVHDDADLNKNHDYVAGIPPSILLFDDDTKEFKGKRKKIDKVLSKYPVNGEKLRELAISEGGLLDDSLRAQAWPLLLGLVDLSSPPAPSEDEIMAHPEYQQVVLDVNRSLKRFPPGIPLEQRLSLQNQLTRLILRVVIRHPRLRYYQGYHDVAVTLLLVTGENAAFFILEHLSMHHLKDCMEATMERTQYLLNFIYPLLRRQNVSLYEHMEKSGVGTMFALPWFLTWFGHSLNRYQDVVRLYDYFLSNEPLLPLYVTAVIVIHRAKEVLQTPCDMPSLHQLLSRIPDDLPFEKLLKKASQLYKSYPPNKIEEEVERRVEGERNQRNMEIALRQRRMARNASLVWRWLDRIDPVRRFPLWGVPQPQNIPVAIRRYRYLMATAVAVGVWAYFMRAVEAASDFR